jgi:hypothetical protein
MKKQLYRAAAATVLGLSLTTGIVAADTGNIGTTGPNSTNTVTSTKTDNSHVSNLNAVSAFSHNYQTARTGYAKSSTNTGGGNATTGAAMNSTSLTAAVNVSNPNSGNSGSNGVMASNSGTISGPTGPYSTNTVSSRYTDNSTVMNHNFVNVVSTNSQTATSGDASVDHNTSGGSATSGNATNTSSSNFTFTVTN